MRKSLIPAQNRQNEIGDYYRRLALRVSLYKYLLAVFIIGFTIFCFSNYKNEITTENFRYMLIFFDTGGAVATVDSGQIALDLDKEYSAATLRGNVAVADTTGFTLYDYSGAQLFRNTIITEHPSLSASGKYVYLYDIGGTVLKVYNTYAEIFSMDSQYPIMGFANNTNGAFAVITTYKNYKSAVFVYDKEFRSIFSKYYGESYAVAISINTEGNRIAVLITGVDAGEYYTQLYVYDTSAEEPVGYYKFVGEMPLKTSYAEDGSLIVLTSAALRTFNSSAELAGEMFFSENSPSGYHFSDKYAIMSYIIGTVNDTSRADVYRLDGTLAASAGFDEEIRDLAADDDHVYVLTYKALHIINVADGDEKVSGIDGDFDKIMISGDYIVFMSDKGAEVRKLGVLIAEAAAKADSSAG